MSPKTPVPDAVTPPKSRRARNAAAVAADDAAVETTERTYRLKPVIEPLPSTKSVWARLQAPFTLGFLLVLGGLAALLLGLALSELSTVLIYIALALFAALGLDPAVRFLERRGMSRSLSIVSVMLGLIAVIAAVLAAVLPTVIRQVGSFVREIPEIVQRFQDGELYASLYNMFGDNLTDLLQQIQGFLSDPGNIWLIGSGALKVGGSVVAVISGTIIVLVLTLYFVATLSSMKQGLLRFAPARDRDNAAMIVDQITDSVGGYVMGMVVLAFLNACIVLILHLVLVLPFPMLMAVFAFLITLIPLVGSVIFWIVGSGLALFTSPTAALIFAIAYFVYMQVEAYLLTPKVMNRTISIPGALVVIGALVGGTLLGLLGALVAIPVTASILIIIKQVWFARQDARV